MRYSYWLVCVVLVLTVISCGLLPETEGEGDGERPTATATTEDPAVFRTLVPRPPEEPVADKWALWTDGTRLRGADLHPCRLFDTAGCLEPITRQDVQDLRDQGANLINASFPGVFTEQPPYQVDPDSLANLDHLIGWADEVGVYVVIHFRTGPGRNEAAIHEVRGALHHVWSDQAAQDGWCAMWRFAAERYRESPVVVGYDLMVEPHPNTLVDPDGELEPDAVQEQAEGTLMNWNALAADITAAIREVDPSTPIIINSLNWGSAEWFAALQPTGDQRTVYSLHAYDPDVYITQGEDETDISYPDIVEGYGEQITFDRTWLEDHYRPVLEFAKAHGAPIYVGEFGAMRWVSGGEAFLRDQTGLFEQYGWNYAVYVWRGDEPDFDGFNLEYGINPDDHAPVPDNPLLALFRERWAANADFPGAPGLFTSGALPLADVRRWLYLIDVDLAPDVVDQIVGSAYDMVVLDYIPSEANNTDYPMASVIARLHDAPAPKLVLAYIDIGEAEDYRTYWQPGWGIGDPEWIAGGDPDGWEGNYPVAFWHDVWREIWLGPEGYLQAIVAAGFDGVYLDWVEAYSDESVSAIAAEEGVDARQEMIWWVADIADFTRSLRPGFIVVAQNAAELVASDAYVSAIDAIAQEQVWFDGGADNDPPGDCPLPRTEAEVDTEAYRESLSRRCRRQYDGYPESTLHVSSEAYLHDLQPAQSQGLSVFTVDYALEPENVAWVYQTARAMGFVPFVGSRALDSFTPPVP